jgi:hypothetical protein
MPKKNQGKNRRNKRKIKNKNKKKQGKIQSGVAYDPLTTKKKNTFIWKNPPKGIYIYIYH